MPKPIIPCAVERPFFQPFKSQPPASILIDAIEHWIEQQPGTLRARSLAMVIERRGTASGQG